MYSIKENVSGRALFFSPSIIAFHQCKGTRLSGSDKGPIIKGFSITPWLVQTSALGRMCGRNSNSGSRALLTSSSHPPPPCSLLYRLYTIGGLMGDGFGVFARPKPWSNRPFGCRNAYGARNWFRIACNDFPGGNKVYLVESLCYFMCG